MSARGLLEGNGAGFVRERALAAAVQRALERLYQLDGTSCVTDFVKEAEAGEREALLVREAQDGAMELELRLPKLARREFDLASAGDLDPLCQLIEGVSHFVYLAERARTGIETTQLELELQAEVDKYVVLAGSGPALSVGRSEAIRARLFELVGFAHQEGSVEGERYRVASDLGHRFVRRLEQRFVEERRFSELRGELRRFYRLGQEEKLRVARAA